MKRIVFGAVVVLLSVAAAAEEPQRYVVATRRPARVAVSSLAREVRDPAMRVTSFNIAHGFAATLTAAQVAELRQSSEVRWIEPMVMRYLMADASQPGQQVLPSGVSHVRAPQSWPGRRTGDVNVAVLDSGIDFHHPDLGGSYQGGYNTLVPEDSPLDDRGHGSHVAGTIAAANNGTGVIGVSPGVRLWGVKVVNKDGNGTVEDVLEGLDWVVRKKAEIGGRWVVNLSLGGAEASALEAEAFANALAAGVVIVASSGNESTPAEPAPVSFPAAYPGVVAVGAINSTNTRASFSNGGPELAFVAPGVGVLSTGRSGLKFASYVRSANKVAPAKSLLGAKTGTLTARYVHCGLGLPEDFPPSVAGAIALIQRGGDTFADKARRAVAAGAVGIAFFNSDDESDYYWTLLPKGDDGAATFPWPIAVGMPRLAGEELAAKGHGVMTVGYESNDYELKNGTSMSAPHVTGAVALLWSFAPNATPAQLTHALETTAHDLGEPGRDNAYGHGLIDINAAARLLAPEAFTPSTRTGRPYLRRGTR